MGTNLLFSVGDNFYDYGVNSTSDPYWQQDFVDVYSDAALQIPWYITLGNHDYMGTVDVQLQYQKVDYNININDLFIIH